MTGLRREDSYGAPGAIKGPDVMKGKAVIAMSGGVDSSVAAALMPERGFECIGVTLKLFNNDDLGNPGASLHGVCGSGTASLRVRGCSSGAASPRLRGCCSLADINDARNVAYRLGMPHYVFNFSDEFREAVIRRFIETYEGGGTPNPCIDCNRYIKFRLLLRRTLELGFDTIVTGHYARIERSGDRFLLKKARDHKKDQTYVLYCLTQEQLARCSFPLGDLTKEEVRAIALERGFVNAGKQDSQDICFIPDRNYSRFIEEYRGHPGIEGDIIDTGGRVLGRHRGIIRYTIGQRRGLGLSFGEPMYVAAKSAVFNTVTLGPESALYTKSLNAERINFIACANLERPVRVTVKTRYLQTEQPAVAEQTDSDRIRVDFDKPQRAIAAGQAVVLYDGEVVVGGGTIL
ncbi:MAG: tRNA 2-thiouridine(34) synthase MnmA [Spirochaetaceae bacterium]|jgi:tRNA-specific 2-thiouridylase|nr:tRNA 2-thiouridine(34) synthase MnmA [Spirochaetaceae bacterium]